MAAIPMSEITNIGRQDNPIYIRITDLDRIKNSNGRITLNDVPKYRYSQEANGYVVETEGTGGAGGVAPTIIEGGGLEGNIYTGGPNRPMSDVDLFTRGRGYDDLADIRYLQELAVARDPGGLDRAVGEGLISQRVADAVKAIQATNVALPNQGEASSPAATAAHSAAVEDSQRPSPQERDPGTLSQEDLWDTYEAGGYGDINERETLFALRTALSDLYQDQSRVGEFDPTGMQPQDPGGQADDFIDRMRSGEAPVGGPGWETMPPLGRDPTIDPPSDPTSARTPTIPATPEAIAIQTELERQKQLSQTVSGRRGVFDAFLGGQAGGESPLYREFQQRQRRPLSDIYNIGQLLGTTGDDETFKDFLGDYGTIGPPDLTNFRRQLGQIPDFLTANFARGSDARARQESLVRDPNRQFSLLNTGYGDLNLPSQFQAAAKRNRQEDFQNAFDIEQYLRSQGVGGPGSPPKDPSVSAFRDFQAAGSFAGGPSRGDFLGNIGQTSELISAREEDLGIGARAYRDELRGNQNRQFNMALRARLPDIAPAFRSGARGIMQREFDRWTGASPAGAQFLPHFTRQNNRFFVPNVQR
jgi:hypothetical protein